MYVEGLIDKDYFDLILAWRHEPDWICTTVGEARLKGYDFVEGDVCEPLFGNKIAVRVWIDMDMEDFFTSEDMIKDDKSLLGLMAVSKNKKLREFAEHKLKEML